MEDITREDTRLAALKHSRCASLPDKWDGKSIWIKAIALVTKRNGKKEYVIVKSKTINDISIVADFGTTSIVVKYDEIYPYEFLKSSYIPKLSGKYQIISYICEMTGTSRSLIERMDNTQLKRALIAVAIKTQISNADDNFVEANMIDEDSINTGDEEFIDNTPVVNPKNESVMDKIAKEINKENKKNETENGKKRNYRRNSGSKE